MAAVTAAMVKELRESTGAGMMECKKALTETDGDMEAAVDVLRKSGAAKVEKKAGRIAAEGITRVASEGNTAVVVEVNSETDFVAKNATFQEFVQILFRQLPQECSILQIKRHDRTPAIERFAVSRKFVLIDHYN